MQNVSNVSQDRDIKDDPVELSGENETASVEGSSTEGLAEELQYNLVAFFSKMQTVLHVSQRATQEIIEHIDQLFSLSEPVTRESVIKTLEKHNYPFTDTLVRLSRQFQREMFCINLSHLKDHCQQLRGDNFIMRRLFHLLSCQ